MDLKSKPLSVIGRSIEKKCGCETGTGDIALVTRASTNKVTFQLSHVDQRKYLRTQASGYHGAALILLHLYQKMSHQGFDHRRCHQRIPYWTRPYHIWLPDYMTCAPVEVHSAFFRIAADLAGGDAAVSCRIPMARQGVCEMGKSKELLFATSG